MKELLIKRVFSWAFRVCEFHWKNVRELRRLMRRSLLLNSLRFAILKDFFKHHVLIHILIISRDIRRFESYFVWLLFFVFHRTLSSLCHFSWLLTLTIAWFYYMNQYLMRNKTSIVLLKQRIICVNATICQSCMSNFSHVLIF